MTFSTDSNCIELRPGADRALWSENMYLRGRLEAATAAAALYPALLREGNHRIKNSLQIVSSLLSLQAGREKAYPAHDALYSAAARVRAVASMHDALQVSEGQDWIDLGAALRKMCQSLKDMGSIASGVDVHVEAGPLSAPVDFVQPVLLAVNELVLNAMRHAFPDGRAGSVVITLATAGDQLRVVVADNGVGLPADRHGAQGFGMKLVEMMTSKIMGAISIDTGAGTSITITTPIPQPAAATVYAGPEAKAQAR